MEISQRGTLKDKALTEWGQLLAPEDLVGLREHLAKREGLTLLERTITLFWARGGVRGEG